MRVFKFNYLASAANNLIPKWAKNWEHLDKVPYFRDALEDSPPDERKKQLEACRRVGWRLNLAFETDNEFERDWLLYDARRIQAKYFPSVIVVTNSSQPKDSVEMLPEDNPLDNLLRFVQKHLVKRMAVCPRKGCGKRYYFRDPGRHGQKYCGQRCAEIVVREGKLRWYHANQRATKSR